MTGAGLPEGLAEELLASAFPFHLLVDADGYVRRMGRSLGRVAPELALGEPVQPHLRISTPRDTGWVRAPRAAPPPGLVLIAAARGPLLLRGQLLPAGDGVLFLGSPWVTSTGQLDALGLRLHDFAAADPVTDLLLVLGAQSSALSDAQQLAEQLADAAARQAHQAQHDDLTGLPNRSRFLTLLDEHTRAGSGSVGVVLLDLDRFQDVNDTLGHHWGDVLLQQVGLRLGSHLQTGDTVARLGGDEFALLVPQPERGAAALAAVQALAGRVVAALHEPFVVDGLTLVVDVSAGIALAPEHGATGEVLLRHADVAMYAAKRSHADPTVYSSDLDGHDPRRLRLLAELRAAVDAGELVLHYQPLLDLARGRVLGAEALVRWQHPREGLLPPSEFVPLAEGSGFIHRLTREVLTLACRQAAVWRAAGRPLVVSVNVSARCLLDLALPAEVERAVTETGLPPELLKLEITESAVIADPGRARTVLSRMRGLGVAVSVDDFGTGYTSLAHLRDLPVQELKIDRSFVTTMVTDPGNAVLVRTAIELASRLGLESVAEGVEDADTLTALAALGCTRAQGYHVGRPLPVAAFDSWLATGGAARAWLAGTAA